MLELPPQEGFYVQIVVFFVFAWILIPLILRPTLEVLARRAERTSGAQAEALAMRDEVEAMGEHPATARARDAAVTART